MSTLVAALLAALACGTAGLAVPALIRRLPEPEPVTQPATGPVVEPVATVSELTEPVEPTEPTEPAERSSGDHPETAPAHRADRFEEQPPPPFAEVAARPGLAWLAAGLSAVAGAMVVASVGWSWPLLFLLPTVPVGVLLGYVDLRTRLLPKVVVVPATLAAVVLAGVCAAVTGDGGALARALLGLVVARSVFWLLWWINSVGLGFGDVRLAALLGLELGWFGWAELAVGTYTSFLVFGLPGLMVAIVRRDRRFLRTAFPFGPAMLVGAMVGLAAGAGLWSHLAGGAG